MKVKCLAVGKNMGEERKDGYERKSRQDGLKFFLIEAEKWNCKHIVCYKKVAKKNGEDRLTFP